MPDTVTRHCPAKVNLFLRVLARESGGFHQLETLFTLISLHDTLEVNRTASGISLEVLGAELGAPEQNLAWRAASLILEATGHRFGVALKLHKRIPAGAGLGGGSSDAAAALHAVNTLADGRVPRAELLNLGASLGADVPFFVSEASSALGWGRGQRLLSLPALEQRPGLLLVPDFEIATVAAYRWLDQDRSQPGSRGGILLEWADLTDWSSLARLGGNDLELPVFGHHPRLREAFLALARTAPILCRMSGSGSTLVGVYRNEERRATAIQELGSSFGTLLPVDIGGRGIILNG